MEKIYIYGTGSKTQKFLPAILQKYEVVGFLDSNKVLQGQHLLGRRIFHMSELHADNYYRIIIVSSYIDEITQALSDAGLTNSIAVEHLSDVMALKEHYVHFKSYCEQQGAKLPQIPLHDKHLEKARLITNRQELLKILPKEGIVAELGVANGDYSSKILNLSAPIKLHLIDVWQSERYNDALFCNVSKKFSSELSAGKVQIHRKLSTDAVHDFPDHYFDWIYIDTTHCYNNTKLELELYESKIKPGGFISGHDYTMGNWQKLYRYGVMEAVHEFCVRYGWRIKYLTMDLSENQSFAIEKIPK